MEIQHPGKYVKFDVQGTTKAALNVDAGPMESARTAPALYPVVRAVVDGTESTNGVQQTLAAIRPDNHNARLWLILPFTDTHAAVANGFAAYKSAQSDASCWTLA